MKLAQPESFFDELRKTLFAPRLSQSEVDGCNALLAAFEAWPPSWTAYGLATAYHETAHTMQPVRERGSDAYFVRLYSPNGLRPQVAHQLGNLSDEDACRFCGRGYPQVTGRDNYARLSTVLGRTLVSDPDLLLRPDIAAKATEFAMRAGFFTGRKLADFLPADGPATRAEFMAARRVVNGQDRADLIADYAVEFQRALELAA